MRTTRKMRLTIIATVAFDRDLDAAPFGADPVHRQALANVIADFITRRTPGALLPMPIEIDTALHFPRVHKGS